MRKIERSPFLAWEQGVFSMALVASGLLPTGDYAISPAGTMDELQIGGRVWSYAGVCRTSAVLLLVVTFQ